ncbi:sensor histidine kinase [Streptacidiphilus jiangxiensis]|uniref:Signal transduction histidine-protein kinase/phosphatase MprB n=1 Tax=Streptacidiphilus jiangxiensis TaxID=235985 RepID=A0A1H7RLF1_STRJI|nr:HAMP domain-containing sensor histidine kinase [Streptacidiphilus jiangxiensis]SEL61071.1 Signal transduction histidine kinase [Streptacidiphilus jiangxiensis]
MRGALFKVCVAVTTMVALAFLIPLGLMVRETARERAFTAAERQAATLGPALAITTDEQALTRALASTQDGAAGLIALHVPRGGTGSGFDTVGHERVGADAVTAAAANGRSGTTGVDGGYAYLEPVAVNDGRVAVIEVFIPDAELTRGVTTAWLVLSGVALTLVLISVAVADRLGTRIVGAARRLAAASKALGEGDLAVRVPQADGSPRELREAAAAFNAMADRVVRLLAAERELAADLSHRLRTPLTVLRLNAASLGQGDAAEQTRHAVAQLEREVDQIIRAVRGRGSAPGAEGAPAAVGCDAAEVIRDRAEFWSALAEDEGRPWQLAGAERPVSVPVPGADLAAALDAMLGNVFRHTPEGTAFSIDVHGTRDGVIVLVSDAGPGIPDPELALRRGAGAQRDGSTGLGLDIVRRVAESTGGDVAVGRSVLGGTEIRVRLLHERSAVPAPRRRARR